MVINDPEDRIFDQHTPAVLVSIDLLKSFPEVAASKQETIQMETLCNDMVHF